MSQAERLATARTALEQIADLAAKDATGPVAAAIEAVARLALTATGETESQAKRRAADADRKRTARGRPPDVRADGVRTAGRTACGQRGGWGGGVFTDLLSDPDLTSKIAHSSSLEGSGEGPAAVRTPSAARVTADAGGWLGTLMTAFAEGVQSVTKLPYPVDAGAPTKAVVNAIRAHCKDPMGQADWAREKSTAWAAVRLAEGRTLSPFDFGQWVASGQPAAREPFIKGVPRSPTHAEARPIHTREEREAIARQMQESGDRARREDAEQARRAVQANGRTRSTPEPIGRVLGQPGAKPAAPPTPLAQGRELTAEERAAKVSKDLERAKALGEQFAREDATKKGAAE